MQENLLVFGENRLGVSILLGSRWNLLSMPSGLP